MVMVWPSYSIVVNPCLLRCSCQFGSHVEHRQQWFWPGQPNPLPSSLLYGSWGHGLATCEACQLVVLAWPAKSIDVKFAMLSFWVMGEWH
jgi:hypothetical protein